MVETGLLQAKHESGKTVLYLFPLDARFVNVAGEVMRLNGPFFSVSFVDLAVIKPGQSVVEITLEE
jgi:hypothetical protein